MLHADVLTMIAETPAARGAFDAQTETRRTVLCTVRSVGMREAYEAMGHGLHPEWVFVLAHDFEYQGEKRCVYHDQEYRVIRVYVTEADGIEITVERSNAACITSS
jgi:hypothetical protein